MVGLPMVGIYNACFANLAPIVASRGFDRQTVGMLLSAFSVAHLIANVLTGLLSDRFGTRLPMSGLTLLAAVGGILVGFGESIPTLNLGVVLIGLSGAFWPLLGTATAVEFGSNGFGRAFGLLSLFLPVAVVTTFIVARVQESTGSYGLPLFSGVAAWTFLGGSACLLIRERRKGNADQPTIRNT